MGASAMTVSPGATWLPSWGGGSPEAPGPACGGRREVRGWLWGVRAQLVAALSGVDRGRAWAFFNSRPLNLMYAQCAT